MSLAAERNVALKSAREIAEAAKSAARDLTADEMKTIEDHLQKADEIAGQIEAATKSTDLLNRLSGAEIVEPEAIKQAAEQMGGSLGERFVKSGAYQDFRQSHPSGIGSGTPVRIEAKGLGGIDELGIGQKATIVTTTGQPAPARLPGYRSNLIDEPITFLDLVTTGSTQASWIEYAQIVSETNNAAIIAEGELKPLSDVTTAKAEAKAHTYADGFDVTNQTLADDGALAAFMQQRIAWHVRNKVEDVLINGDVASNVKGILNTTGVQAQAFTTDVITTIANAMQKVEARQVAPQAIVMNPADAWALSLTKEANVGYVLGNPLQQSLNPSPFGVRLVKSNRVAAGTALVGNFTGVQLLEREPLSVVAFNQHKDYAQRNMAYVRAELRALQFIYAPADIVVADLTAA